MTALKNGETTITATLKRGTEEIATTATGVKITVSGAYGALGTATGTPASGTTVNLDSWVGTYGYDYAYFQVTPVFYAADGTAVDATKYTVSYLWSVNGVSQTGNTVNSSAFALYYSNSSLKYGTNTLTCTATFTYEGQNYTAVASWNITTNSDSYLASVNVTSSYTYYLGDKDDANGSSIVDQLVSQFNYLNSGYYGLAYVQFRGTTHTYGSVNANTYTNYYPTASSGASYLGNVVFTPGTSAGKAIIPVRVYYYTVSGQTSTTTYVDGNICFDTSGSISSGDVNFIGVTGDTVYFDASEFDAFYYSKSNGGTLSYVTFGTISAGTGTLYSDGGVRLSSGTPCYLSPSTRQTALDGVYFTPSGTTASKGGAVRINFTASGNRSTYSGTVLITYLNGSAKDITYTPSSGSVNLKVSDFTDAYRAVMGSTAPADMTVQFQDVPANGTLSYKNSSSSSASSVTLRSSNVKSYRFTTRTTGANQLGDVTYTASGTKTDTIEYIAYAGGAARFTGKVVFNPSSAATTVIVNTSSGSAGIAFNLGSFTTANPTVLANTTQIQFVMPSRGTLTYLGSTVTNTGVTVPISQLSQVYYRPNAGYNGTDTVLFFCQDASGSQVGSGQVNIAVSGNTGNSTGVTSASQFTDIPKDGSANWYINELNYLISQGVVQGTSSTKVEPRGTLDYGQALKMILVAAGYTQTEGTGNEWAINYKNYAVSRGWISSDITLTAPITRDATVELAAKVLGISPVTDNSPFKDSNNGYAIALNRTSPQIILGNANGTFNGSGTLLRQEVWMIVYRMMQYRNAQYSSQKPDGI